MIMILIAIAGICYLGCKLAAIAEKISAQQEAYYTEILNEAVPAGTSEIPP